MAPEFVSAPFALGVSDDAKSFATSLYRAVLRRQHRAGGHQLVTRAAGGDLAGDFAAASGLAGQPRPGVVPAFGLLVLASPDASRFASTMGTDFLARIAELASAALTRLR